MAANGDVIKICLSRLMNFRILKKVTQMHQFHTTTNENEVVKLNIELKAFCDVNLLGYINNDNIDESCFGVKKLHLNKIGHEYFAKKLINYKKSVYCDVTALKVNLKGQLGQ